VSTQPSACRAWADRYIQLVNERRYPELASIFAPGCMYLNRAAKRPLHDPDEIARFYAELHDATKPIARISRWFEDGDTCAFEIESSRGGNPEMLLGGVDIVTVDVEGRATRFTAFPFGALESWE
jgi:SnoaL-like protein